MATQSKITSAFADSRKIGYHHVEYDFLKGSQQHAMFNKMFSIMHAMEAAPYGSWILWVDRDVLFINTSVSIREMVEHAQAARTTPSDCSIVVSTSVNAGIVLYRKTCWTMRMLDYWLRRTREDDGLCGRVTHGYDQVVFTFALLELLGWKEAYSRDPKLALSLTSVPLSLPQQNLTYPKCSAWVWHKSLLTGWLIASHTFIVNRSASAGSRVCTSKGNPGFGYLLLHFIQSSTHIHTKFCLAKTALALGADEACGADSRSGLLPSCVTEGKNLFPQEVSGWAPHEVLNQFGSLWRGERGRASTEG